MSNKRKANSTKPQSALQTCKNNWIFTATLDPDAVEKLCLTIFDSNRNLNSQIFEYAIVGTNETLDSKKGGRTLYDVYGYVQIKRNRWTCKELIRHFGVSVTTYSATELVFGTPEGKWKPNSVVEHVKMVCPSHYTEGGELRNRGTKPNTKKEDSSESADDDLDITGEDFEEEEEEPEPVARRFVTARPNPFIPSNKPLESPDVSSSFIPQRLNVKPAATTVPSRSFTSNTNRITIGRTNSAEPILQPHSIAAVSSRATVAANGGGKKEFQFQSPFPGLKNDLCKHLEKHLTEKIDSRLNFYLQELEKRNEEHLQAIILEVYKAITDTFASQVALGTPEEQEDLDVHGDNEIGNEEEEKNPN